MDKGSKRGWYWLLLIPFVGTLWVSSYAGAKPELAGFPFFYWYLLAWVVVSAIITGTVYRMTR